MVNRINDVSLDVYFDIKSQAYTLQLYAVKTSGIFIFGKYNGIPVKFKSWKKVGKTHLQICVLFLQGIVNFSKELWLFFGKKNVCNWTKDFDFILLIACTCARHFYQTSKLSRLKIKMPNYLPLLSTQYALATLFAP